MKVGDLVKQKDCDTDLVYEVSNVKADARGFWIQLSCDPTNPKAHAGRTKYLFGDVWYSHEMYEG